MLKLLSEIGKLHQFGETNQHIKIQQIKLITKRKLRECLEYVKGLVPHSDFKSFHKCCLNFLFHGLCQWEIIFIIQNSLVIEYYHMT